MEAPQKVKKLGLVCSRDWWVGSYWPLSLLKILRTVKSIFCGQFLQQAIITDDMFTIIICVPGSQRGYYKKMSDEGASSVRVAVDCSFEQLMSAKVSCQKLSATILFLGSTEANQTVAEMLCCQQTISSSLASKRVEYWTAVTCTWMNFLYWGGLSPHCSTMWLALVVNWSQSWIADI